MYNVVQRVFLSLALNLSADISLDVFIFFYFIPKYYVFIFVGNFFNRKGEMYTIVSSVSILV